MHLQLRHTGRGQSTLQLKVGVLGSYLRLGCGKGSPPGGPSGQPESW